MGDCEEDFMEVSLGEDQLLFVASPLISFPNLLGVSRFSKCSSSTLFSKTLCLLSRSCPVMAVGLGTMSYGERSVEGEVVIR